MIAKWKFIGRKVLLDHPRMKIVEDYVELPNGKKIDYIREAPADKDSVAIVAINDRNEILLQKEYSYPPDEVLYQLPGGAANDSEEIIAAANRELSEESGYIGKDCQIIGYFYLNNRRSDRKQHVVLCRDLIEQKHPQDDEEFIASMWVSLDKVGQLIKNNEITNVGLLAALRLLDAQ
jgi:8-oxo-dGTP pyrophosphatase MutT (NUDIX family)